jgi:hypothetical protein
MTALCVRGLKAARPLRLIAVAVFLAAASAALADEPIEVRLDQAMILKIPERAATVVIGNPLIADLSIQPGGLAVITGKSYGSTNVIVIDHSGAVLTEQTVEVRGPSDKVVVVYRGVDRQTYSCQPTCEPRITLGDEDKFFSGAINEATTRNNQALSAGTGR